MLLSALIGNKGLFITANTIGFVGWLVIMISYASREYRLELMFDFDNTCIAIGTWLGGILFLVAIIIAISSKKVVKNNETKSLHTTLQMQPETVYEVNKVENETIIPATCPNCGKEIDDNASFCGKCGHKF